MCQQMSVRRYKFRYSVQMGLRYWEGALGCHWFCRAYVLQWLWGWVHRGGGWGIDRKGAVFWTAGGSKFNGMGWWVVNCASG